MRSRFARLLQLLSVFVLYTSYKIAELLPWSGWAAVLGALALALALFAVMTAGMFLYRPKPNIFDAPWFRLLAWTGSLGMAAWATFIIVSIPVDLVHLLFAISGHADTGTWHLVALAVFAISLALSSIGFAQVLGGPRVKNTRIAIDSLAPSLVGLRIAHVSDLHVGTTVRAGYVEGVVARVNAAAPDFVFLTGDIVDAYAASVSRHLSALAGLAPKYGSFYVTGNHEYYWDPAAIIAELRRLGIKPLLNEAVIVDVGASRLLIGGVTDPAGAHLLTGHAPSVAAALASGLGAELKILLAHRPDVCARAEPLGFDIQFSGHTHAGQFFPFSLFIGLAHRYSRGLYRHGRLWLYVNPGTGYWGPANRLGVAAEISIISLEQG